MTSFDFGILNVQSHDLSSLCNALLIEITFSFYQISYMMDRAGELKEFIWRWVWCCHIFQIARWETIMLSYISNNVVIYFQLQDERQLSQNTFTGGPAWRRPLGRWLRRGSYSQPSSSSNSSRWMSSENTRWTRWSQETQNIGYPGQLVFWPVLKRLTIRVYFASIPQTS